MFLEIGQQISLKLVNSFKSKTWCKTLRDDYLERFSLPSFITSITDSMTYKLNKPLNTEQVSRTGNQPSAGPGTSKTLQECEQQPPTLPSISIQPRWRKRKVPRKGINYHTGKPSSPNVIELENGPVGTSLPMASTGLHQSSWLTHTRWCPKWGTVNLWLGKCKKKDKKSEQEIQTESWWLTKELLLWVLCSQLQETMNTSRENLERADKTACNSRIKLSFPVPISGCPWSFKSADVQVLSKGPNLTEEAILMLLSPI